MNMFIVILLISLIQMRRGNSPFYLGYYICPDCGGSKYNCRYNGCKNNDDNEGAVVAVIMLIVAGAGIIMVVSQIVEQLINKAIVFANNLFAVINDPFAVVNYITNKLCSIEPYNYFNSIIVSTVELSYELGNHMREHPNEWAQFATFILFNIVVNGVLICIAGCIYGCVKKISA